jgi:hypothetical protein
MMWVRSLDNAGGSVAVEGVTVDVTVEWQRSSPAGATAGAIGMQQV